MSHSTRVPHRIASFGVAVAALAHLSSCAGTTGREGALRPVYPAPPESPRLQYLTHYSTSRDVAPDRTGFARMVLGERDAEDRLVKPYGFALHAGVLYVCDTQRNLVQLLDLNEGRFGYLGFQGGGRLRKPINLCIDADGTKYVADAERGEVVVFGPDDGYRGRFGGDVLERPVDVALSGDLVWVCDAGSCEIVAFSKSGWSITSRFGGKGSEAGEFARPTNLAVDDRGHLYVSDTLNGRVQKLDAAGSALQTFGGLGTGLGRFARPKGIAVDPAGRLYAVDAAFENVQIFDPDGRLLLFFGDASDHPGEDGAGRLHLPAQVSIDTEHVALFEKYANPGFAIEYLVLVSSQYGPRKVTVYGFGSDRSGS